MVKCSQDTLYIILTYDTTRLDVVIHHGYRHAYRVPDVRVSNNYNFLYFDFPAHNKSIICFHLITRRGRTRRITNKVSFKAEHEPANRRKTPPRQREIVRFRFFRSRLAGTCFY